MKKLLFLVLGVLLLGGCGIKVNNTELTNKPDPSVVAPSNKKILNLSNQEITRVDMEIFNQTGLEELNLSRNQLTGALPSEIGKLKNLRVLKVSNNLMTGVPAEVGQLSNLEILDLSNNQLTGLPNELANLKNLKTLNLSGNKYSEADLQVIRDSLPSVNYILE